MSRPRGIKNDKTRHKWTDEEKEYLALIVKGRTSKDITRLINEKFKINLVISSLVLPLTIEAKYSFSLSVHLCLVLLLVPFGLLILTL